MADGRIIIESSSAEGVMEAIEVLQCEFQYVCSTIPVKTNDGRYISSVIYSNNTRTLEIQR